MTARTPLAILLLGLFAFGAREVPAADPAPRILQIDLPGVLVAGAVTRGPTPSLWLATREGEEEALTLHRFDTGPSPALALRAARAPAGAETLASADFQGDGSDELVLLAPGSWALVDRSTGSSAPQPLYEGDGRWARGPQPETIACPSDHRPVLSRVGSLSPLGLEAGRARATGEIRLPVRAEAREWGLRLTSPRPVPVPGGGWLAWEAPEGREIAATWIPPGEEPVALRLRLPEPERIENARPLSLDGAPYLFVAGFVRMGPMANQRIRLFPLPHTPGPVEPVLAREIEVHVWHSIEAFGADVDGDDRDELVLAMPEGMGGGDLWILSFDVTGTGAVDPRPAETKLDLHGARWTFGPDLDGDGRADLLLFAGGRLTLFPGLRPGGTLPKSLGTDLTAHLGSPDPEPVETRVEIGTEVDVETAAKPGPVRHQVVDVDGDGIAEVLAWRTTGDRTRLVLVRLTRAGADQ